MAHFKQELIADVVCVHVASPSSFVTPEINEFILISNSHILLTLLIDKHMYINF